MSNEREKFEAWIRTQEGHPFAGQFGNLMWKAWQARASLSAPAPEPPLYAAPPAVQGEPVRKPTHRCKVCGATWKHYGVGASLIGKAKCMECDLEPIPPADDEAVRLLKRVSDELPLSNALLLEVDTYLVKVKK